MGRWLKGALFAGGKMQRWVTRPSSPNSRLPFPHLLVPGLPPSLPHPTANSAPTKLGRKRKIDDSRCRKHRLPSPHLLPPTSLAELSRLSALCLLCPCISLNGISRPYTSSPKLFQTVRWQSFLRFNPHPHPAIKSCCNLISSTSESNIPASDRPPAPRVTLISI